MIFYVRISRLLEFMVPNLSAESLNRPRRTKQHMLSRRGLLGARVPSTD